MYAQNADTKQKPFNARKRPYDITKTIDKINCEKMQRQKEIIDAAKTLLDNINET